MERVRTSLDDHVCKITLNRPSKKNALTLSMYRDLTSVLEEAANDPEVRVVLITGKGDSFTAGNDICDFVAAVDEPELLRDILTFLHRLATFPKPLLAAVQGDAVGIGTTLLLHCDLVIAADSLRCRMPFVQLGLLPEAGSTLLFPQLAGHPHSFELLVEGAEFDAERALQIGLINQIVPVKHLIESALLRAKKLATLPQDSVYETKRLMKQPQLETLCKTIDEEGAIFKTYLSSPAAKKAFLSFLSR